MTESQTERQTALWEEPHDPFILTIRQTDATPCGGRFFSLKRRERFPRIVCGCGSKVVRSGCMQKDCPDCAGQVGRRRAMRVKDRLDKGRQGRPVLYTVLTVPPRLRGRYTDRKRWRTDVKAFVKELRRFGMFYAIEVTHPIGSRHPEKFHPHANILWVQKPEYRPFLDLDLMRRLWYKILDCEKEGVLTVDIDHQYLKKGGQIYHRCKYVTRVFPGFGEWLGSMRWFGKYPGIEVFVATCKECGQAYVFLGWADREDFESQEAQKARGP